MIIDNLILSNNPRMLLNESSHSTKAFGANRSNQLSLALKRKLLKEGVKLELCHQL